MAQVNIVNKQVEMNRGEIIKFQLITHCQINKINLTELDVECLIEVGLAGYSDLTEFCNNMAEKRLLSKLKSWVPDVNSPNLRKPEASPQTIRNVLIKVEKENLLIKESRGKKRISLNPKLKIQTEGNILLNYKLIHIGS